MKKIGRRCLLLLAVLFMLTAVSVSAAVVLKPTKLTLQVGKTSALKVTGTTAKVTWTTSNKNLATVTQKGVVKALKPGTVRIGAKVSNKTYYCTVTIPKPSLSVSGVNLKIGGSYTITLKNAGSAAVTWTSSNKKAATVSAKGLVKGIAPGSAKITAKIAGVTLVCAVSVMKPVLNVSKLELRAGSTYSLALKNTGTGAVSWSSANSAIAKVSAKGVVTGVAAGTTRVTGKVAGTAYPCTVVVKPKLTTTTTTTTTQVRNTAGDITTPTPSSTPVNVISFATANSAYNALSKNVSDTSQLTALRKMTNLIGTKDEHFPNGYLEGTPYTNDNYYKWRGGYYRGGYGCAGFCFKLSDTAFERNPAVMQDISYYKSASQIKVGDIIRMDYDTHSVIALKIENDRVIVGEANYNKSIHWGRQISFAEIKKTGNNIMTRYASPEVRASGAYLAKVAEIMRERENYPDLY